MDQNDIASHQRNLYCYRKIFTTTVIAHDNSTFFRLFVTDEACGIILFRILTNNNHVVREIFDRRLTYNCYSIQSVFPKKLFQISFNS